MENRLQEALLSFLEILSELQIDYALIGGLATGYWGEERFTKDIDLTIALDPSKWHLLKERLERSSDLVIDSVHHDPESLLPYLIRLHYKGDAIDLIVSLTEYQDSLLNRKVEIKIFDRVIFLASPEDIIVSKLIAGRPQDLVDIKKIYDALSDLDQKYIEKWSEVWDVRDRWEKVKKD